MNDELRITERSKLINLIAAQEIGVVEDGINRGPRVSQYIAAAHGHDGDPWCAAFVTWCGLQFASRYGYTWPLRPTMGCRALGEDAVKHNVRFLHPADGAIFLLYFPSLSRFAHTGFVEKQISDSRWQTIEGNTNPAGGREGYGVFRRIRTFKPEDRFIRWWMAL